ncbi:MAG: hypothetical protein NT042_07855 [Sulfuritalea sp.]|jgi:hypothetical protein|nr:hypothetical protein [Sulfuritalea sp.]
MTDPVTGADRRANPQLRTLFIDAYEVLLPFFDPANSWGGQTHEHLAYRALHEQFPSLSTQEVFTLVAAARRVFSTSGKPVAP